MSEIVCFAFSTTPFAAVLDAAAFGPMDPDDAIFDAVLDAAAFGPEDRDDEIFDAVLDAAAFGPKERFRQRGHLLCGHMRAVKGAKAASKVVEWGS